MESEEASQDGGSGSYQVLTGVCSGMREREPAAYIGAWRLLTIASELQDK